MTTATRGDTVARMDDRYGRYVVVESRDGPPLTEDELVEAYRSIHVETWPDRRQHREEER